jgi:ABC-type transporter Mla subunit MlaD
MKSMANIQEETGAVLGAALAELTSRGIRPELNPLIEKTDALTDGVRNQSGELTKLTHELNSLRRETSATLTDIRKRGEVNAQSIQELHSLVERLQLKMVELSSQERQIIREVATHLRTDLRHLGDGTLAELKKSHEELAQKFLQESTLNQARSTRLEKFGLTTDLLLKLVMANLLLTGILIAVFLSK